MRSCQGEGSPGLGNWNGSMGRMASQRKSSMKLGMSKRRSAAGMERVSASSEREGLCNWWNGLSGMAMVGTRAVEGMRILFIGAASGCAARYGSGRGLADRPGGYPVRTGRVVAWTRQAAEAGPVHRCVTGASAPG